MFDRFATRLIPSLALLVWSMASASLAWAQEASGGAIRGGQCDDGQLGRNDWPHFYPLYRDYYDSPWWYRGGSSATPFGYNRLRYGPARSSSYAPYGNAAPARSARADYQRQAQAAFRTRDYDQAARWANQAVLEIPRDGKQYLFLAQALFAVGDYRAAAEAVHMGMDLLDVVKNFRRYYTNADYVEQVKRLEAFVEKHPDDASARFLLGYHYGFLGYPAEARSELAKAAELESGDQFAARLLKLFPGEPPTDTSN